MTNQFQLERGKIGINNFFYIYEKESKTTDYTLQNLKLLNNTTKTMPWGAKDHDSPWPYIKRKEKKT